jgi:ABC-type nitrate/sulfonate/bicarbonate transport system ATPase subunit
LPEEAEGRKRRAESLWTSSASGLRVHYPHQLSGGMRQRVELVRALGGETDLLLMDEPFSSLDYLTRLRMRGELTRLLREQPRTVVLDTHDIEEAAQLADRVLVLTDRPGRVARRGAPHPGARDATHPEVVRAVHHILTELGLETDTKPWPRERPGGTPMRSPLALGPRHSPWSWARTAPRQALGPVGEKKLEEREALAVGFPSPAT